MYNIPMKDCKKIVESKDKYLLKLEVVIGYISAISFLIMIFIASYVDMPALLRVALIAVGSVVLAIGACTCIKIEQIAGYYECAKCGHRHVPKYFTVFFAIHVGRTRYMRCPKCGEKSWQRKVIGK